MFSSWPLAAKTTGTTVKARECHWWWKSKTSKEYDMIFIYQWASLVAQRLKHLPPMQETRVRSLGREDPLEKEMATHSSTLAWRIPWREESGRLQSMGSHWVRHDWSDLAAFFMVQLSHPCMTTGRAAAWTRWTCVGKVMPLLFNELPSCVITFLPRSQCLLTSWLQSPSPVILRPKKMKPVTASTSSPSFALQWWDQILWS